MPATRSKTASARSTTRNPSANERDEALPPLPIFPLLALPDELLTNIILLTDLPSALSISLVCRKLNSCAQATIWRDLELGASCLPPLVIDPRPRRSTIGPPGPRYYPVDPEINNDLIVDKMRAISKQGNEKSSWGMVRSITICPNTAVRETMSMLKKVADHVQALTFDGEVACFGGQSFGPEESLGLGLVRSKTVFPALTHVNISSYAFKLAQVVPHLCNLAPNLTHLSFHIDINHTQSYGLSRPLVKITCLRKTKLRRLCIGMSEGDAALQTKLANVVAQSPELRQLFVSRNLRHWEDETPVTNALLAGVGGCDQLEDLVWDNNSSIEREWLDGASSEVAANVRRLAYRAIWSWKLASDDIVGQPHATLTAKFKYVPALPNLEALYLNRELHLGDTDDVDADYPSARPSTYPTFGITPDASRRLRGAPRLRTIHCCCYRWKVPGPQLLDKMDDVERTGKRVIGLIRSIRNRGRELVMASLFLAWVQVLDVPATQVNSLPDSIIRRSHVEYLAQDGSARVKVFEGLPESTWQDFSDYDGVAVPMEIIQQMREVEGASEADWDARGVEVGDEAWKVLLDWMDARPRESD